MAKYSDRVMSVAGTAEPARVRVATVSRDFFGVLGVQPSLGRGFTAGTPASAPRRSPS